MKTQDTHLQQATGHTDNIQCMDTRHSDGRGLKSDLLKDTVENAVFSRVFNDCQMDILGAEDTCWKKKTGLENSFL